MIVCDLCNSKIAGKVFDCVECTDDCHYCKKCVATFDDDVLCIKHIPQCKVCLQIVVQNTCCCYECGDPIHRQCSIMIIRSTYCTTCAPKCVECSSNITSYAYACDLCYDKSCYMHKKCSEKFEGNRLCKKHYNLEKNKAKTAKVIAEYAKQFWEAVGLTMAGVSYSATGENEITFNGKLNLPSGVNSRLRFYSSVVMNNSGEAASLKHKVDGIADSNRTYNVSLLNHDNMVKEMRLKLIRSARSKKSSLTKELCERQRIIPRGNRYIRSLRAKYANIKGRLNKIINTLCIKAEQVTI